MEKTKISLILTSHSEEYYLWMTLKSISAMLEELKKKKISSELILVADDVNQETKSIILNAKESISKVVYCNFRDPAMSRNLGIEMARGELIAILDGDDLYSKNWLCDAYDFYSKSENKNLCLHPQYNLIFEGSIGWWKHIEQQSKYFSPIYLMTVNYWQSNCIYPKVLHKKCTYTPSSFEEGIGYEDWSFNCDVISAGYIHKVVPDTSHLIRNKWLGSRNQLAESSNLVVRQTELFDEINKIEYPKKGTGYYSKNESKIIPRQLFQHAEQLSDVDPYIKTQLRQTKNITRTHPPQISALFFRDYKRLIHILDDVVSFTGSEAQQSHSIKLGSIIYLENSGVVCSNKIGDITKISANHEPEIISHLFYRSFLFRKVKNINIFNSRFGIYIVKQISKAFNSHFSVVFYFTISNEDDFIEKFGPDILHLIRLGVPANNIRLSSHLYKKFLSIYSEQWKESICEFSGS